MVLEMMGASVEEINDTGDKFCPLITPFEELYSITGMDCLKSPKPAITKRSFKIIINYKHSLLPKLILLESNPAVDETTANGAAVVEYPKSTGATVGV